MTGRIVNVRPKPGYTMDSSGQFMRDGALANVLSGRGTSVDQSTHNFWHGHNMPPQQIEAAYRSSWLVRQIVDIPAQDMTRAGRDWDGDDAEIEKIELEEKRLGYWAKVRQALIYGRLGGGALFINLGDDPASPIPTNLRPQQIQSLIPLFHTQLTLGQEIDDVLDPLFGEPSSFQLNTQKTPFIHASRLITFKGQGVPGFTAVDWQRKFWGDSIVQTVDEAVKNATTATAGFASLIDESKVDIITMPGMYELLAQPGGERRFMEALDAAARGKSLHRMLALGPGETWETRELQLSGAKDLISTYLGIVAGAADIPATRLLGKSPDGMNSTGESDLTNYYDSIAAQQDDDLRPALERLDSLVLASAGATPDLTWKFSPIRTLTAQQQAEIENKEALTYKTLIDTGTFDEKALEESFSTRMVESQRWPGYKEARKANRVTAGEGTDETELGIVPIGTETTNGGKEVDPTSPTARAQGENRAPARAANDGEPTETEHGD